MVGVLYMLNRNKYNFDEIINRKGTNCAKYDGLKKKFGYEDLKPLWVADMDFKTPSFINDETITLCCREQERKAEMELKREIERRAREEALENERRLEAARIAREKERLKVYFIVQKHFL